MRGLSLWALASTPIMATVAAAVGDPAATADIPWTVYIQMLTPIVIFVMGLMAKPLLENTVNKKISEFEALEEAAHDKIVRAIEHVTEGFTKHNTDVFAHPNLATNEKLDMKLDGLAEDLASLREEVGAMRSRVTKPHTTKKGKK